MKEVFLILYEEITHENEYSCFFFILCNFSPDDDLLV